MTEAEIISMAREALLPSDELYHSNLVLFAALVAAAEREECARIADIGNDPRPASNPERYLSGVNTASKLVAQDIAYKIRARGEK